MLTHKASPHLHRLRLILSPNPISPHKSLFSSSSASMDPTTTIEHVVLFKVNTTDPPKVDAMVTKLRSLNSLDIATHLTAGPILRFRSSSAALSFTHLLHCRYRSKSDLAAYAVHPTHLSVVKDNAPICEDIMAVDWVLNGQLPAPSPGSALRLMLAKPKEAAATADVLAAIDGIKGLPAVAGAAQLSYGENFSPARAKGFTLGFISVFPSVEQLDDVMESGELVEAQEEKVMPLVESLIVLDCVIPSSETQAAYV